MTQANVKKLRKEWHVLYSGKYLRMQTFANLPSEAPEEIFTVLIFATKPCLAPYQVAVKNFSGFYFCGIWVIRENRKICTM